MIYGFYMMDAQKDLSLGNIEALIVIYNKRLPDSFTFRSIQRIPGIHITIADNSTARLENEKSAREAGCGYIDMQGNQGLSRAYNRTISALEKNEDILCLFDDDTRVTEEYFSALRKAAKEHAEADVFVPVVMDKVGMLSPCVLRGIEGRRVKTAKEIPLESISAINSGMAIRLKVFRDYVYDEGQFLDYIDHAFIRDVIHQGTSKLFVMEDAVIEQAFSGSENRSLEAEKTRFEIYKKDIGWFCRKYGISSFQRRTHLLKRQLYLFAKALWRLRRNNG